jgi:hypothetical protein
MSLPDREQRVLDGIETVLQDGEAGGSDVRAFHAPGRG